MSKLSAPSFAPIAIPLSVRWRQWRRRVLPAVSFLLCLGMAGWLWTRQAAVTHGWGEVYAPLVELNAPVAGELKATAQVAPRLYDFVEAGQELASIQSNGKIGLVIAPVTGHLTELYAQPGQIVSVGAKLFRITPDQGEYIVGFVNRRANQQPSKRTPIIVRTKEREPQIFETTIEEVGPAGSAPKIKGNPAPLVETAIPVRVGIPKKVHLRPGQLVELQFPPMEKPPESGMAETALETSVEKKL